MKKRCVRTSREKGQGTRNAGRRPARQLPCRQKSPSQGAAAEPEKSETFESINLAYHRQALRHAEVLYWVYAILWLGLAVWLSYAVVYFSIDRLDAWLRIAPGVLLIPLAREVGKARQRVSEAHDKLRADRERSKALDMVNNVDDVRLKGFLQVVATLEAIGVSTSSAEFSRLVGVLLKTPPKELPVGKNTEQPSGSRQRRV